LASILVPKNAGETEEAPSVYNTMAMAKILAETIDNSIMPEQDKASSKS
jgi:hypothetical protein